MSRSLAERNRIARAVGNDTHSVADVGGKRTPGLSLTGSKIINLVAEAYRVGIRSVLAPPSRDWCIRRTIEGRNGHRPRKISGLIPIDSRIPSGWSARREYKAIDNLASRDSRGQSGLFQKWQHCDEWTQSLVVSQVSCARIHEGSCSCSNRNQFLVGAFIVMNSQTDLLQIVAALHPTSGLTCGLNRRQQQPH